jgi:quercetin dioxygenase-like cupin family protein
MSAAPTVDVEAFRAALAAEGYEAVERVLPPGPRSDTHTHPFHAKALILEGVFTITVDGTPTTYGAGEVFALAAGTPHEEEPGPEGVRYLAGRKPA